MRNKAKRLLWGIFCIWPAAAAFTASATPSDNLYCCNDANGHRICGNPLPAACYNRAYKELSRGGRTTREVAAPLSAEERQRKDAADKAQKEAEARLAERRRRDKALLDSYSSVSVIDARRNASLSAAAKEIEVFRRQEAHLVAERKQQEARLAASKTKTPPRALQDDIASTNSELAALRSVIAQKQRDYDVQKARFDEDRSRYLELTGQSSTR
ncbi:hypothetical protein [Niveibacterium terrae]|uniref:hypothetical protein n=1 Tax=Niveibacterium terrae TaxID=3373598 RepID=UPI003A91C061